MAPRLRDEEPCARLTRNLRNLRFHPRIARCHRTSRRRRSCPIRASRRRSCPIRSRRDPTSPIRSSRSRSRRPNRSCPIRSRHTQNDPCPTPDRLSSLRTSADWSLRSSPSAPSADDLRVVSNEAQPPSAGPLRRARSVRAPRLRPRAVSMQRGRGCSRTAPPVTRPRSFRNRRVVHHHPGDHVPAAVPVASDLRSCQWVFPADGIPNLVGRPGAGTAASGSRTIWEEHRA
jgi:hypothetical protein